MHFLSLFGWKYVQKKYNAKIVHNNKMTEVGSDVYNKVYERFKTVVNVSFINIF